MQPIYDRVHVRGRAEEDRSRSSILKPKMITSRVRGRPVLVYYHGATHTSRQAPALSRSDVLACDHTYVIPINIAARAYVRKGLHYTARAKLHARIIPR